MGRPPGHLKTDHEKENIRRAALLSKRDPEVIVRLAREVTEKAIAVLVELLQDEEQPGAVRVRSAEILLERGWGKTPQQIFLRDETSKLGMAGIPIMERVAGLRAASQGETIDLEASELLTIPEGESEQIIEPDPSPPRKGAEFV